MCLAQVQIDMPYFYNRHYPIYFTREMIVYIYYIFFWYIRVCIHHTIVYAYVVGVIPNRTEQNRTFIWLEWYFVWKWLIECNGLFSILCFISNYNITHSCTSYSYCNNKLIHVLFDISWHQKSFWHIQRLPNSW